MKFKIGDKVKIGGTYPKGSIGEDKNKIFTIWKITDNENYRLDRGGTWAEEWLESVTADEEVEVKKMFSWRTRRNDWLSWNKLYRNRWRL